jgi:hypothetical protein
MKTVISCSKRESVALLLAGSMALGIGLSVFDLFAGSVAPMAVCSGSCLSQDCSAECICGPPPTNLCVAC